MVDTEHGTQEGSKDQEDPKHVWGSIHNQEDQGNQITLSQIHSLLSCSKVELNTALDAGF